MVLLVLLLAALACLVLGLVFASAGWLIGSLAASAATGLLIIRERNVVQRRRRRAAAVAPPAPAVAIPADAAVLVLDGRPNFHVTGCPEVVGTEAVPVPLSQALDDGFLACPVCDPLTVTGADPVLVVDGQARYHAAGCSELDASAMAVPRAQAVADGFSPCPICQAEEATPGSGAPVAESAGPLSEVWVVDGRPRYHRAGCVILEDQPVELVPRAQAVEDGFQPCSMCNPDGAALV